jgi:hypothetical protein
MAGGAFQGGLRLVAAFVLVLFCAAGCVRREGRNSDCRWPAETGEHLASAQHLSRDAEFAEDLAIRYADVHHGLHTPYWESREAYGAARDRCMGTLFEQIAKEHGVPVERVYSSLGRNRGYIDLAVNLPFMLLYCFVAVAATRMIWRRYPPAEDGWITGATMILLLSLAFALEGTMVGRLWSGIAEQFRVGNGRSSYRALRLPWLRHETALFASLLILFWLAAIEVTRRMRLKHSLPPDRDLQSHPYGRIL